jgi:hypothetical protein
VLKLVIIMIFFIAIYMIFFIEKQCSENVAMGNWIIVWFWTSGESETFS